MKELTITVGDESFTTLIPKLQGNNVRISDFATRLIDGTPLPTNKEKVTFVVGTLETLFGFQDKVKTQHFLNSDFLRQHGLGLCSMADAPFIRHYYPQPLQESLKVGIPPLLIQVDNNELHPLIFQISTFEQNNRIIKFLWTSGAKHDTMWAHNTVWIFRKL